MDYISEAVDILKEYNTLLLSVENIEEQIRALRLEKDNIKAMRLSLAPAHGCSEPDDKIANNIFRRKTLYNNLIATKKRIKCIERSLYILNDTERKVINRLIVIGGKNGVDDLMESLKYSKSQVYNIKDSAIRKFSRAIFGIGTE